MPTAFVLINAEVGAEDEVLKDLQKIGNVEEAYVVVNPLSEQNTIYNGFTARYGSYDVIAKVKADDMDKLKQTVTGEIRRLDKVRNTLTMIVISKMSRQKPRTLTSPFSTLYTYILQRIPRGINA